MHFPTKKDANDLQPEFLHAAGAVREYGCRPTLTRWRLLET
jgi:hypothetical protein